MHFVALSLGSGGMEAHESTSPPPSPFPGAKLRECDDPRRVRAYKGCGRETGDLENHKFKHCVYLNTAFVLITVVL